MNKNKRKINMIIPIVFSLITYYLRFEFCIQSNKLCDIIIKKH